jgi:hypothetical protein
MAKKKQKSAAKRKPEKKALVFQLGEFSSLPNLVRVCREVAKCPARHRPVDEYLRWTFMIVHDRWADDLELPPWDRSLPKEADGDYVPGFASGVYDLLGQLPGWNAIVPPAKGMANYYLEDHVELSVAEVAEHLRGRGFEIVSATELRATDVRPDYEGEIWDEAEALIRNGAAARLIQGMRTYTWEAPEDGWQDRVVEKLVSCGMQAEAARELVVLHVVHDQTLGYSDALWLLVKRRELREQFADDPKQQKEVEQAIQRALKEVRSTFKLKFPREV